MEPIFVLGVIWLVLLPLGVIALSLSKWRTSGKGDNPGRDVMLFGGIVMVAIRGLSYWIYPEPLRVYDFYALSELAYFIVFLIGAALAVTYIQDVLLAHIENGEIKEALEDARGGRVSPMDLPMDEEEKGQ